MLKQPGPAATATDAADEWVRLAERSRTGEGVRRDAAEALAWLEKHGKTGVVAP